MDTVQDKLEAFVIDRTTDPLEKAYDNWVKNAMELNELVVQKHRAAKGCAGPIPNRTTNLLEHDDWIDNALELDRLQAEIRRANEESHRLQTLIQKTHEVRYNAMKRDHDSALKPVQTEKVYRAEATEKAWIRFRMWLRIPNPQRAEVIEKEWKRFRMWLQSEEPCRSDRRSTEKVQDVVTV